MALNVWLLFVLVAHVSCARRLALQDRPRFVAASSVLGLNALALHAPVPTATVRSTGVVKLQRNFVVLSLKRSIHLHSQTSASGFVVSNALAANQKVQNHFSPTKEHKFQAGGCFVSVTMTRRMDCICKRRPREAVLLETHLGLKGSKDLQSIYSGNR